MLTEYCQDVDVVSTAHDVSSGIKAIQGHSPELVFLDIELEGDAAFEVLESLKNERFALIFVTGYRDFAIQAIKESALDYLVKPIDLMSL